MKKMSRKIAAIIAAAMTATTMGAMNAFADDPISFPAETNHYENIAAPTKSVDLSIIPYNGTHTDASPTDITDVDYSVWKITVDKDELVWKVARNTNGGTYNVKWDPDAHKYIGEQVANPFVSFTLYDEDVATKSVTLTNLCNFPVGYVASIDCTQTNLFGIDSGSSGTIPVYDNTQEAGYNTASTAVTINLANMTDSYWTSSGLSANESTHTKTTVGTLNYTFSVAGNSVADADQYSGLRP